MSTLPRHGVSLSGVRWDPAEHEATTERLERIVKATLKRNLERPEVDFTAFDPSDLDQDARDALGFFVRQLQYIEDVGAQNLALLARYQNISAIRAAYCAQVQDERAHSSLLARYGDLLGAETVAKWQPVLGTAAGKLIQRDVYSGSVGVMTMVEFYASRLLDQMRGRLKEPLFEALISHILVDEHRHRALAIEATTLMESRGYADGRVPRARLKVAEELARVFFVHMIAPMLDRYAPMLELDGRAVYEQAYDEIQAELTNARAGA
jgi:hypothetical protein